MQANLIFQVILFFDSFKGQLPTLISMKIEADPNHRCKVGLIVTACIKSCETVQYVLL